jgi:flavin reductase (DIM6/NTAB) family NADH-FMN oxidoreductase RutF
MSKSVEFDLRALGSAESYRLLVSLVVPRPIAWVTTVNQAGLVNAAPFSFFNLMGADPPVVALGIARDASRPLGLKDTARNILQTGEFVVQLVNEPLAQAMNLCATEFPPEQSEIEATGLQLAPAVKVNVPRLAEAPVHLECRHVTTVDIGRTRVLLGEVVYLHLDEQFYDATKRHVKTEEMQIIGRMHGRGGYTRTTDLFEMPRISYEAWQKQQAELG